MTLKMFQTGSCYTYLFVCLFFFLILGCEFDKWRIKCGRSHCWSLKYSHNATAWSRAGRWNKVSYYGNIIFNNIFVGGPIPRKIDRSLSYGKWDCYKIRNMICPKWWGAGSQIVFFIQKQWALLTLFCHWDNALIWKQLWRYCGLK